MASLGRTYAQLKTFARDNLLHGIKVTDDRQIVRAVWNGLEKAATERDWSWMKVNTYKVLTIAPYTTGTASGSAGSATITGSGTTWTSAMVGRFIKFATLPELYEIKTFSSTTSIVLQDVLRSAVAASTTYTILAIKYDLPDNFREMRGVNDLTRRAEDSGVCPTDDASFETLLATYHTTGSDPDVYAVLPKRDSVKSQLGFFPPPDGARYYQCMYMKHPGWFNASTGAFETEPTADSSLVDWPREYRAVLEKAILCEAAAEFKNGGWQQQAEYAFSTAVESAKKRDAISLEPAYYGQGAVGVQRLPIFRDDNGAEVG